ncbi:hypothetical protein E4U23_000814 [Claviceps purpurea]|nr:hypothetical protein E4U23_000814 [Claviceps purpurea]
MHDSSTSSPPSAISTPSTRDAPLTPFQRQARQLGLFFAGAGLLAASVAVSRRSVLRRKLESFPRFYSGNLVVYKMDFGERSLLAAQALSYATLNVASFGVMLTGGISWAFDLCGLRDLQARTRVKLEHQGTVSAEDEEEMEKMMVTILDKLGLPHPKHGGGEDVVREDQERG